MPSVVPAGLDKFMICLPSVETLGILENRVVRWRFDTHANRNTRDVNAVFESELE